MVDFKALVLAARQQQGWASGSGDIDSVRIQAKSLGWSEVPVRRGDQPVSVLKPVEPDSAHPRSLSAQYGLGDQPCTPTVRTWPARPKLLSSPCLAQARRRHSCG